jgi:hypothetical protein
MPAQPPAARPHMPVNAELPKPFDLEAMSAVVARCTDPNVPARAAAAVLSVKTPSRSTAKSTMGALATTVRRSSSLACRLGLLARGDVGTEADPLADATVVQDRRAAHGEAAIDAFVPAHAVLCLIDAAGVWTCNI